MPTSNNFIRDDIYLSERTTERIIFKDKENLPSPKKKVIELKMSKFNYCEKESDKEREIYRHVPNKLQNSQLSENNTDAC